MRGTSRLPSASIVSAPRAWFWPPARTLTAERGRLSGGSRARSRRYLKPVLGCLRRNRRRLFAAAVTRYLKSVHAAVAAGIGTSLVSRQPGDRPRKVTRGLAAKPGSGAIAARTLPAIRGRQVADGKPIRRAGPPAARAPEAARQQRRSGTWERYGEQRAVCARAGQLAARIRTRALG
jgi:hypothetical protein